MSYKTGFQCQLSQKLGQQLAMTPQLQQAIRLLQLSSLELQAELCHQLESNPLLEWEEASEDDSAAWSEGIGQYDHNGLTRSNQRQTSNWAEYTEEGPAAEQLSDYLEKQLLPVALTPLETRIAYVILHALDDDGYLRATDEELLTCLPEDASVTVQDIAAMVHLIQKLDPPGIAARSVPECLLLQLQAQKQQLADKNTPTFETLTLAEKIIGEHLDLCAAHQYPTLRKELQCSDQAIRAAMRFIRRLNPRPGHSIVSDVCNYIIPDVLVYKKQQHWEVELNPHALPKIRLQGEYAQWLKKRISQAEQLFLRERLQEARWLIKSLESRNDTLLKVAQCIVESQEAFFEYGEEALKPMVLQDVATALSLHESTISRITTQKYLYCAKGVYELKYFFSSHVGTEDGGECSSRAIRSFIKKIIAQENPDKPMSDQQIAVLLEGEGIQIARRTVAKYRDQLRIPSSSERKKIKWLEKVEK